MIDLNPYKSDAKDKFEIWNLLVKRDFEAFLREDWEAVKSDYLTENFYGFNFKKSLNNSEWKIGYSNLAAYRAAWLQDSKQFNQITFKKDPLPLLFNCCRLENWEFIDNMCSVHKVFDGSLPVLESNPIPLRWRSIFLLQRENLRWRISSFVGYMPI